jgi:hypothetical protein
LGKTEKYQLNLGDKTLYLTEESEIKYAKNHLQEWMLGSHYVIEDDIPNAGTSLPHTELRASTFNQFPDNGEKGHYQSYTQGTKWLIEVIKKFGEKI